MSNENEEQQKSSGKGVAIGLLLCGIVLLAFPKFVDWNSIASWAFYGVGLVLLLLGIMGICIEMGKGKREKEVDTYDAYQGRNRS